MLTMETQIFIFILISLAITMALVMAEEHHKHSEWRHGWEDGKSEIAGRMALLS